MRFLLLRLIAVHCAPVYVSRVKDLLQTVPHVPMAISCIQPIIRVFYTAQPTWDYSMIQQHGNAHLALIHNA